MPTSPAASALGLAGSLGGVTTAAGAGAVLISAGEDWYADLDKPRWAMPRKAFAPTWALVAAAQAIGAWLLWRADDRRDAVDVPALSSYAMQMWLSLSWLLLFFGLRRPAMAMLEVCVLWLAVVLTLAEFARHHRYAAAFLVPSLVAVTYLTMLNASIWRRNRD